MLQRWTRALLAVAALALLVAGGVMIALAPREARPVAAASSFTIEILPNGDFNPPSCVVSRNDSTVFFLNKDTKPHRIVVPDIPSHGPPWNAEYPFQLDTGYIAPGATSSSGWLFSSVNGFTYYDYDSTAMTGTIVVPVNPDSGSACSPLPPTPTPTPTFTPSPTPTATPTKAPSQMTPPTCARFFATPQGCGLAISAASDGADE
jgi:hypothetical protein